MWDLAPRRALPPLQDLKAERAENAPAWEHREVLQLAFSYRWSFFGLSFSNSFAKIRGSFTNWTLSVLSSESGCPIQSSKDLGPLDCPGREVNGVLRSLAPPPLSTHFHVMLSPLPLSAHFHMMRTMTKQSELPAVSLWCRRNTQTPHPETNRALRVFPFSMGEVQDWLSSTEHRVKERVSDGLSCDQGNKKGIYFEVKNAKKKKKKRKSRWDWAMREGSRKDGWVKKHKLVLHITRPGCSR